MTSRTKRSIARLALPLALLAYAALPLAAGAQEVSGAGNNPGVSPPPVTSEDTETVAGEVARRDAVSGGEAVAGEVARRDVEAIQLPRSGGFGGLAGPEVVLGALGLLAVGRRLRRGG